MLAITGVTGKVGGTIARSLLAQGQKVRAIVRVDEKGRPWSAQGCDIAIASIEDAASLTQAFEGAIGASPGHCYRKSPRRTRLWRDCDGTRSGLRRPSENR